MRNYRKRRNDGMVDGAIHLVAECISLARKVAPMKGVAAGLVLLVLFFGLVPLIFKLASGQGLAGAVLGGVLTLIGGFLKILAGFGALACFTHAGINLTKNWEYEEYPFLQAIVIAAASVGLAFYGVTRLTGQPENQRTYPVSPLVTAAPVQGLAPHSLTDVVNSALPGNRSSVTSNVGQDAAQAFVAPIQNSTNISLVEIQYLNARKMKVVRESQCMSYVDLVLAAQRTTGFDINSQNLARQRVEEALQQGWNARCFVLKSKEELLSPMLKNYWDNNVARLNNSPGCSMYKKWAEEVVYSDAPEAERQYQLTKLFTDANQKRCLQ